jgi:glycine oxidase
VKQAGLSLKGIEPTTKKVKVHDNMIDALIVGGGLLGLLTARELSLAGLQVVILEQGQVGRESSWAGGGIISPLYPWRYDAAVTALATWSQSYYPELVEWLFAESGIDPEYTLSGLLIVEPEGMDQAFSWCQANNQEVELLQGSEIRACEPAFSREAAQALWLSGVAQIRNPRLVKAAYRSISDKVTVQTDVAVRGIVVSKGRAQAVLTEKGEIAAGCIIVCAGAWSGGLLEGIVAKPDISPVMGQMILFKAASDAIRRIVLHEERYVIPRRDGRVLVGSTLEKVGFRKHTTTQALRELEGYALRRFPVLGQAKIEHHWAGLRPGSPKGIPYIGQVPGVEGLYINAGHFRNGVVLGPASARLLADQVLGRTPIISPAAYRIGAAGH